MLSVRLGASDTMRRTGSGTRTLRPVSSVTSVNAEGVVRGTPFCVRVGTENRSSSSATRGAVTPLLWSRKGTDCPPDPKKKIPTRFRGARRRTLSREACLQPRRGRVAWLTATFADHSGGTAADSHGLPRFPGLQIVRLVYA